MDSLYPWYRKPAIVIGNIFKYALVGIGAALLATLVLVASVLLALAITALWGLFPALVLFVCWNWVLAGALGYATVKFVVFWAGCTAVMLIVRLATGSIHVTTKSGDPTAGLDELQKIINRANRNRRGW